MSEKKKVAIVIDDLGWCFDNIGNQVKNNLKEYYDVDVLPQHELFGDDFYKMLIYCEKYDIIHILWRGYISWLADEYTIYQIEELGFKFEDFMDRFVRNKVILTSVYDHKFLDSEFERNKTIFENVKNYSVSSNILNDIYSNLENIKKPQMVITDGVDLELFKPVNLERLERKDDKLIVGWTGNSKFTDDHDDDLKGVNAIILPAIKELKDEGYNVELDVADKNIKSRTHEEMPEYYNELDLYICTSRTEGTPNPVLESMACGIPIISTNCGIVSDAFGSKQKEFIIERTKEALKNKIIEIYNNRNLLKELSEENLKQIKDWDWKVKTLKFKEFYDKNITK